MTLDPALIERLRENSHIRLDQDGRFWHEGAPVEHPLVVQAFHRGLGRAPDGRPTITFGRTWCYIAAEGYLYRVIAAICEAAPDGSLSSCRLRLDDSTEEPLRLQPGGVGIDGEGVLHARVKERHEWARFLPSAQAEVGRWATADAAGQLGLATHEGFLPLVPVEHRLSETDHTISTA